MSIAKIYKHYKLTPQKLKEILDKYAITEDLRFVKTVPENWIEILSNETGIQKINLNNYLPPKKEATTANNGIKISGNVDKLKNIRNNFQKAAPTYKTSFAYVKFVAPDKSHAFIRIISDLNTINEENFRDRTDNDYRITKDCVELDFHQIILCKTINKHKDAEIITTYFNGYLKENNSNILLRKNQFHLLNHDAVPFSVDEHTTKYRIISRELFFEKRAISTKSITIEPDYSNYINQIKNEVKALIKNEVIDDVAIEKIKLLITNSSEIDINNLLKIQFDIDCYNKSYFNEELEFEKFVKKWSLLKLEWLTLSNFNNLNLFIVYFRYWNENQLPLDFWGEQLINACIQYEIKHLADEQEKSLHQSLQTKHKNLVSETLTTFFETTFLIDSFEIYNALIKITADFLPTQLGTFQEQINESLPDDLKFKLWAENKTEKFPKEFSIAAFEKQNEEIQIKIIKNLHDNELIEILPVINKINDAECILKLSHVSQIYIHEAIDSICFDLETDRNKIFEIAWSSTETTKYFKIENEISNGLDEFKIEVSQKERLLVGHNCIDFDCVELEKQGFDFSGKMIWDTFLIEMLLSPELKNFALQTKHSADFDAKHTESLFYNQVLRLIVLPQDHLKLVGKYMDPEIFNKISNLKSNHNWNWLSLEILDILKLDFFRPQPKEIKIVSKLRETLLNKPAEINIIITPEPLKKHFVEIENSCFVNNNLEKEWGILNLEKCKNFDFKDNWIKSCIEIIVNHYHNSSKIPYWGTLAPAVRIRIENQISDVFSLLTFINENKEFKTYNRIFTVKEWENSKSQIEDFNKVQLIIIEKDLLILENKTVLKSITIQEMAETIKDNHFWLKFSGGQSYVEVTKKEIEKMNVKFPKDYNNFWIEKFDFSNFRVWGNLSIENKWKTFKSESILYVNLVKTDIQKTKTFFPKVQIDIKANDEFVSFNTDTIYRSRYWLFQKEIILQILDPYTPIILLIQNQNEVIELENYFRYLGFYIPKGEISLGRRMELIHRHYSNKKMLIAPISKLDSIMELNYVNNVNVIIESIKLFETYFISKNSSLFKNDQEESYQEIIEKIEDENGYETENDTDFATNINTKKPLFKDFYFHLQLQSPLIQLYKNLVFNNFSDNNLWILDSRISDFSDIAEHWKVTSRKIILGTKLNFEEELKTIEDYIAGPKPLKELPFTLEETKSILSAIFLDGNTWYPSQEPHLNIIIPAKEDWLVTLPTGGGKSLLFQGPAILRNAFTNKLTIVITPLRALMQDQVEALWDKGFYGGVEYLNSDRGTDSKLIYKAMASGEIALLFITPERFRSSAFKKALNIRIKTDGGLEYVVFDEAHCLSQWGHEFRPDYFNSAKEVTYLKKAATEYFPLLLFSATVSKKIYDDFNTIFYEN
jgi:hypothetical protein